MAHGLPTYDSGLVMVTQALRHSAVSHLALVTYACTNDGALSAQECADAVQNAWNGSWPIMADNNCTAEPPEILLGDGTTSPLYALAAGPPVVGTSNIACPSPNIAMLIKKTTALAGRKNRGRMYLPFHLDESGIDEKGLITGDAPGLAATATSIFMDALVANDLPMVIANRATAIDGATGKKYVSAYHTGATVTGFNMEPYVATQRRRMPRS